jgi:hypothetical protein
MTVELEAGRYYTVAASGFFNPPAGSGASGSLVIQMEPGTTAQVRGPRNYLVSVSEPTTLSGLTAGDYTVAAAREGFVPAEYEVEVPAGSTVTLPITLQEGTGAEAEVVPEGGGLEVSEPTWYKTQLQLYQDDYSALPRAGEALLRVVHAAPAVAAISVGEAGGAADQPLVEGLSFPNASDYLVLPAGADGLEIRLAGTDLVLSLPELPLEGGAIYTLYLMGSVSSDALIPLPTVDALIRGVLP